MTKNVFDNADQVVTGVGPDNVVVPYAGDTASGSVGVTGTATGFRVQTFARVSQAAEEAAVTPTSAAARVSQALIEVVITADVNDAQARASQVGIEAAYVRATNAGVSQAGIEGAIGADNPSARVSQAGDETSITPTDAAARFSQAGAETSITPTDAKARLSQAGVEATITPTDAAARMSQAGIEVAVSIYHHKRTYAQIVGL